MSHRVWVEVRDKHPVRHRGRGEGDEERQGWVLGTQEVAPCSARLHGLGV